MTARDLAEYADRHPLLLLGVFAGLPVAAWLCGRLHERGGGGQAPWKYCYSVLVYAACVPGLCAGVLTGYALFFTRQNLMDVSLVVFLAPIVAMVTTLILIRKSVEFDQVPGFDRISGLMVMIACSFAVALAIEKTRLFVVFGGSIGTLFLLAAAVFALIKWGAYMLFRRRDEPRREIPRFPQP